MGGGGGQHYFNLGGIYRDTLYIMTPGHPFSFKETESLEGNCLIANKEYPVQGFLSLSHNFKNRHRPRREKFGIKTKIFTLNAGNILPHFNLENTSVAQKLTKWKHS